MDKVVDLPAGPQGHIVAALDVVESFLGGGAKPLELGLVFLLALLQQAEGFPHYFAGVTEAAGGYAGRDEVVEVFGEIDVSGWHRKYSYTAILAETGNFCQHLSRVPLSVKKSLLSCRQGQEQGSRLARDWEDSVAPIESGRQIVLGINQQSERGCGVLNSPMHGVHQHQLAQAAPLKRAVDGKPPDANRRQSGIAGQALGFIGRKIH